MSMISAQIDGLRKAAEYYDGSEVAAIMRDAADTIWQLRDDLQRANAVTLGPCSDSCNCTNGERTGTCRNSAPTYLDFLCSECGFVHYHSDANDTGDENEWRFCPNCGRRVVEVNDG